LKADQYGQTIPPFDRQRFRATSTLPQRVSRSILLVLSSRIGWSLRCIIFVDLGHGLGTTVLVTDFDYVDTSGEAHDQRKNLRHR
jgi:hypothetical protein